MIGERTLDGWQLRLRPRGAGRFVSAAFLMVWLCGWALGEALALWLLAKGAVSLVTGQPLNPGGQPLSFGSAGVVGAFLLFWLAIWTLGGVLAIGELMRSLFGEDRLLVSGGQLTLTRLRGPFRTRRVFERQAIRRIVTLAPLEALVLDAGSRRVELSRLGTRSERVDAVPALLRELAIPQQHLEPGRALPADWQEVVTPEGSRALVPNVSTRRIQARICGILALGAAAITGFVARDSTSQPTLAGLAGIGLLLTGTLLASAVWLARGRMEWRIETGRLTLRKRFGSSVRSEFEARKLVLESRSDTDGDSWHELYGLGEGEHATATSITLPPRRPKNSRRIARRMNDQPAVMDLAVWLAREANLPLDDRTTPEARAAELARLKAALEGSGRFGRWTARWLDRLSERQGGRN
ncbi:MAG: hypothetical protein ACKVXR_09300 [Planctomycetota bacterium]